jgi:hypothetical protein
MSDDTSSDQQAVVDPPCRLCLLVNLGYLACEAEALIPKPPVREQSMYAAG